MRIHRLRTKDVDWLLRSPDLFDDPADPRASRLYLSDPANVFLLASEDGRAAGFLRGTEMRQPHTHRPQMFLYEIAVLPEFRRRGVARSLIRWLLAYCRRRGFDEVFVFTSPNNRAAVRLYRSTGGVTETDADRMFVYQLSPASRRPKRIGRASGE